MGREKFMRNGNNTSVDPAEFHITAVTASAPAHGPSRAWVNRATWNASTPSAASPHRR